MTERLSSMGIRSAWDLANADAWTLRKQFSAVIEKTPANCAAHPASNWET